MQASRLEADILQAVIKHAQENHTPTEVILLALSNSVLHWTNHLVNTKVAKAIREDIP